MNNYRKKPVVIEAIQYNGSNSVEIEKFSAGAIVKVGGKSDQMHVTTLEGLVYAVTGDWIIKGINSEFYPCKPDIFEKTYEPVSGDSDKEPTNLSGVQLIAKERQEQLTIHNLSLDHDVKKEANKTLVLASLYLLNAYCDIENGGQWPPHWEQEWRDKFDKKTGVGSLKVAGALIAAEIDRLQNQ